GAAPVPLPAPAAAPPAAPGAAAPGAAAPPPLAPLLPDAGAPGAAGAALVPGAVTAPPFAPADPADPAEVPDTAGRGAWVSRSRTARPTTTPLRSRAAASRGSASSIGSGLRSGGVRRSRAKSRLITPLTAGSTTGCRR